MASARNSERNLIADELPRSSTAQINTTSDEYMEIRTQQN